MDTTLRALIATELVNATIEDLLNVRSSWRLTPALDLDAALYGVGPWQMGGASGYSRAELHTSWNVTWSMTVNAGVQNLFDRRHTETSLYLYETPTDIPRSASASAAWRF